MHLLFAEPPAHGLRPGILLDRDGVVNQRIVGGYIADWSAFRFVRGIQAALGRLSRLGLPIVVVSNQAGVGKGLVSPSTLRKLTIRFIALLAQAGARIDAVYYCPHTPAQRCGCRKPQPGLLQQAAVDWRLDLRRSVLIGDSVSDLEAARAVGCQAIWLRAGNDLFSGAGAGKQVRVARRPAEIPLIVQRFLATERPGSTRRPGLGPYLE